MNTIIGILLGALAGISILFFKYRSKSTSPTTRAEEKAILKKLKKQEKEDKKITAKHKKVSAKTSVIKESVTSSHNAREKDMGDLYSKKD